MPEHTLHLEPAQLQHLVGADAAAALMRLPALYRAQAAAAGAGAGAAAAAAAASAISPSCSHAVSVRNLPAPRAAAGATAAFMAAGTEGAPPPRRAPPPLRRGIRSCCHCHPTTIGDATDAGSRAAAGRRTPTCCVWGPCYIMLYELL